MEKIIKIESKEINGEWYVVGDGMKMKMASKEHADAVSSYLMIIDIPDPNFKPGRRKKSV